MTEFSSKVYNMKLKTVITEHFQDYKYPNMYLAFPSCTFKCERECGFSVCHNSALAARPTKEYDPSFIVLEYLSNPITTAIVCGGLEPIDSFEDLLLFVSVLRNSGCLDDIVIYTGYEQEEILDKIAQLKVWPNIIVKFGRFRPNEESHFDEVLGVSLASSNQRAERIS